MGRLVDSKSSRARAVSSIFQSTNLPIYQFLLARDAKQPGSLAVSLLVLLQPLQHAHEDVLSQLFSRLARAGHAEEVAVDGNVVSLEQLGRRCCHSISSHPDITMEKRNN